jgi:hypothetical protein
LSKHVGRQRGIRIEGVIPSTLANSRRLFPAATRAFRMTSPMLGCVFATFAA